MADKSKMIQKLLDAGQENYSKALAALRSGGKESLPTFLRETEEAVVEDPRLVTQAAKRVLPDIETQAVNLGEQLALPPGGMSLPPSIGSMADDVVSAAAKPSNLPNMAPAMVGAGLLGIGAASYLTDENEPPSLSTAVPKSILDQSNRQLPKGTKVNESVKKEIKAQTKAREQVAEAMQDSGTPVAMPTDDFDARLAAARKQDVDSNLLMGVLKAAQTGASGASGSKADTSYADDLLSKQNKFADQFATSEKLRKDNKETKDEDVLRDPNSDISKQARDIAKKVGLKVGANVTAQQLKTAGLPIGNLLTQHMAIEARKEQAQLQREMIAATRLEKREKTALDSDIKERDKVDKMVSNLTKSDDYKGYQAAKTAKAALDNALAEGNKAAIGSAFMMYAKIAQGDNSVVRESDMKNLAGSYNYSSPNEMLSKLAAKAKGAGFTTKEMEQMRQVATVIESSKAKHIKEQLSPITTRFEKYGLNPAESLDPALLRELQSTELPDSSTSGLTTTSKAPKTQSSAPVTIRSKKSGTTKTLSAESAAKYLANPDFERVQ